MFNTQLDGETKPDLTLAHEPRCLDGNARAGPDLGRIPPGSARWRGAFRRRRATAADHAANAHPPRGDLRVVATDLPRQRAVWAIPPRRSVVLPVVRPRAVPPGPPGTAGPATSG